MLIDLTLKVESNSPIFGWVESQLNKLAALGHVGTHLDTHSRSTVPLDYFKSRGVVFDVKGKSEIDVSDVDLSKINKGDFVLFYTGSIEKFVYGSGEYFGEHPQLSPELIDELLSRQIRFIGVDAAGIRRGDEHGIADKHCESCGVYVIENLHNLGAIKADEFTVFSMWIDDSELTGLKCRVIAEC